MLLFQEWSDGGVRGECKKMEIGCSEVNVMVQECRYDEQEFFHEKERHTDTSSYVKCSVGVGSFTNTGLEVNDPNNAYLILTRSRLKKRSYGEGVLYPTKRPRGLRLSRKIDTAIHVAISYKS